jgi:CheY-like chemotaxis protein
MLVLLVDDKPVIRQMVRRMPQQAGHEVVEGANGQEGLQRLEALAIELALTDTVMPVMNGIEFIKQARLLRPSLVMIAMSSGGSDRRYRPSVGARAHGAGATLHKPFRTADLRQAIAQGFEGTLAQNA